MELRWTVEGRECAARYGTEDEARECAALVRTRPGVQDVLLIDEDGVTQGFTQGIPQALR